MKQFRRQELIDKQKDVVIFSLGNLGSKRTAELDYVRLQLNTDAVVGCEGLWKGQKERSYIAVRPEDDIDDTSPKCDEAFMENLLMLLEEYGQETFLAVQGDTRLTDLLTLDDKLGIGNCEYMGHLTNVKPEIAKAQDAYTKTQDGRYYIVR